MEGARWERIQALFHAACDLPAEERAEFLRGECGGDFELLVEVEALVDADARGGSILERPVAAVADDLLGGPDAFTAQSLGPYTIKEVLGEGGMGVVYLAERSDLGSVVAIKILRDAWLSPARRERFAAEQRTLAQLSHPAIARIYDADSLPEGTPWFAMEYVEGVPITEYCRAHDTSIEGRLELFRGVCEAVQHAHGHAVIHRDLKPSNILVTRDGRVKLLDFGIAKHVDPRDATIDQTRTGFRMMTPAYAAPEQIRGDRVGIRTDVYGLGVILYELLAGAHPFDLANCTPAEAASIVCNHEPERPSTVVRRLGRLGPRGRSSGTTSWPDLDVLCLTAMHKDEARRYPTVDALIRDVDNYLASEPLEARPDTVGYRLGKFVRRNRVAVVSASLVLGTIVALVVFYTVRLTTARNTALAEAARTQRIQKFMLRLFEGGDEAAGPSEDLRVVTLVDRGVQEARSLDSEPAVQAELYETLGGIYQKLGNLSRADELLRMALDERRSLLGPDDPDVAGSLVALGLLRSDQAKYEEGERLIRAGLDKATRALPPGHPAVASATSALGHALVERGSYAEATRILEEAVRLHERDRRATPELAADLHELANAHFYRGHWAEAESLTARVLAMNRSLYGDKHPLVADDLIDLGAIQNEQGRYVEAERFYRQALEITRAWYGDGHPKTASNLTMLGRALVYQKRYDEATTLLKEALSIQERVLGPDHPRVASVVNDLGAVALHTDRFDEAEASFRRMADIYRKTYPAGHYLIGIALSNLASVYQARKQDREAEKLYREAIAIYEATLSPGHLNTGIARIKLGRSLLRLKLFAEAERESLAGYTIVSKQSDPGVAWLQTARIDLAEEYDALGRHDDAERFRTQGAAAPATTAKRN
jgi:serine/threonine protein kinase/tetratricopeptide (TPR) repeat protein